MPRRSDQIAPLSRQHLQALIEGRALRDLPATADAAARRDAGRRLLAFWAQEGSVHFRLEEERLLPWFSRHAPVDRPGVVRMLLEHAEIRGRVQALQETLAGGGTPDGGALRDLGTRLMAHVRLEEDEVFPMMEGAVPAEALQALVILEAES